MVQIAFIGLAIVAVFVAGTIGSSAAMLPVLDESTQGDYSEPPADQPDYVTPADQSTLDQIIGAATNALGQLTMEFSPQIILFWQAIGFAEGFGIVGAVPTRANNRGDLSQGDFGDTGDYLMAADGEEVIVYPDLATGDRAGHQKLQNIVNGGSKVYNLEMTIAEMGEKWAGNAQVWSNNVATFLQQNGVPATPATKLSEVLS